MFEECITLQDLNKSRMEAVKSGIDCKIVNAAYNNRRKEIMVYSKPYKVIDIHRAPSVNIEPVVYIPYIGNSNTPGTIEITPEGVKC